MPEPNTPTAANHRPGLTLSLGAWARANAIGFGLAFGLFALVGGALEAMGAGHDSLARNVPALLAMAVGGAGLALLRRGALGAGRSGVSWHLPVIALCVPAGFVVGLVAPLDWTVALLLTGTVAGALQLRALRPVRVGNLLASAGSWLAAGVAATAVVIVVMDVVVVGLARVDMQAIDADPGALSVAVFTGAFTLLGLAGGAVGGAIEGAVTRRWLRRRSG